MLHFPRVLGDASQCRRSDNVTVRVAHKKIAALRGQDGIQPRPEARDMAPPIEIRSAAFCHPPVHHLCVFHQQGFRFGTRDIGAAGLPLYEKPRLGSIFDCIRSQR